MIRLKREIISPLAFDSLQDFMYVSETNSCRNPADNTGVICNLFIFCWGMTEGVGLNILMSYCRQEKGGRLLLQPFVLSWVHTGQCSGRFVVMRWTITINRPHRAVCTIYVFRSAVHAAKSHDVVTYTMGLNCAAPGNRSQLRVHTARCVRATSDVVKSFQLNSQTQDSEGRMGLWRISWDTKRFLYGFLIGYNRIKEDV